MRRNPEEMSAFTNETERPVENALRDTPLRYFGYLGILGKACRSLIPYNMANMASATYVCADAFTSSADRSAHRGTETDAMKTAGDVFLWHFLATFAFPGIFLRGVSSIVSQLQNPRAKCRPRSRLIFLPCLLGALTLPLISKPIDRTVDDFMNNYVRKPKLVQESRTTPKEQPTKVKESKVKQEVHRSDERTHQTSESNYSKWKWFYDQSKDLSDLEIERYHQKLNDQEKRHQKEIRDRMYSYKPSVPQRQDFYLPPFQETPPPRMRPKYDFVPSLPQAPQQAETAQTPDRTELLPSKSESEETYFGERTTERNTQNNLNWDYELPRSNRRSEEELDDDNLRSRQVQVDRTSAPPKPDRPITKEYY